MALLSQADLWTFSLFVGSPILFGIIFSCICGCRQSFNDFLFYSGRLPAIPCAISLLLCLSPEGLLDAPSDFLVNGIASLLYPVPALIGFLLTSLPMAYLLLPLRALSLNDVLRQRFRSRLTGLLGCSMATLVVLLHLVKSLDRPTRLVEEVTDGEISRHFAAIGLVSLGALCALLGGLRAVVWAAAGQVFVVIASGIMAIVLGVLETGGVAEVMKRSSQSGHFDAPALSPDPRFYPTLPAALLTPIIPWMFAAVSPQTVQRFRALRSFPSACRAIVLTTVLLTIFLVLCDVVGISLVSLSPCKLINPYIVTFRRPLPPAIRGFLLAGLVSGAVAYAGSTVSGLVAMIWEDLVQNFRFWAAERGQTTAVATLLGLLISAQAVLLSHFSHSIALLPAAKILYSSLTGAYIGLVLLSVICPQLTSSTIVLGPIFALGFCMWHGLGAVNAGITSISPLQNSTCLVTTSDSPANIYSGLNGFYAVDSAWRPVIAFLITMLVGGIAGQFGNKEDTEPDPAYILCVCCRCCKACRVEDEEEDGMEDFDFLPHESICPVHSRSNINIDSSTIRTEIIPMRTSTTS